MQSEVPSDPKEQAVSTLVLWRYMDFVKFVSLVEMSALWFSRLGALQDKYEGTIPEPSYREMKARDVEVAAWRDDPSWKIAAQRMTDENEQGGRTVLVVIIPPAPSAVVRIALDFFFVI